MVEILDSAEGVMGFRNTILKYFVGFRKKFKHFNNKFKHINNKYASQILNFHCFFVNLQSDNCHNQNGYEQYTSITGLRLI